MHYLSHILPQLAGDGVETAAEAAEEGEVSRRQEIFRTVTDLLAQINDRPLVLLVDDLHFADEATLLLLSVLMKRQDLSVLIISTTIDTLKLDGEEKSSPLERFYASYHETLGIVRMTLSPLRAADIDLHLDGIFPGLKASADLGKELARITQGNPLFVSEVVRKLVTDQKISPKDQGWTIEELEDNYLPRSLEEIVLQQISALDEESRQLLAHASTFGEDVSLSFLTGSSEQEEARVLEFLDRAEALGLVRLDFQINDETMSFLSKRVVEIAYGTLNQNRREELHERVGNYQEKLFEQRLLTSASLLAYHFKRSADRVKAQRYEKVQFAHDRAVFDAREAQWYADNDYFEYAEALKPESLPLVPDVLRTLLAATRSIRLYPEESQPLRSARQHAQSAIDALLAANEALSLSRAEAGLRANSVELDATEFQTLADSFTALLDGADLQSVTFRRGVSEQEMICLLEIISETRTESLGRGYWKQFAAEHGFEHIALRQVRYSRIKSKSTATIQTPEASVEDELTPGELAQIPDLLRVFLRAAKNIKLYPAGSQPLITVVQHFHQSLKSALSRLPVLTLAAVNESLLVNGAKLSSLELVIIVESFVAYIDSVGLKSLSFFADITPVEVEIFLGALRERPADVDERYWEEVARTHALPGLAFNTQRYALDSLRGASKIEPTPTLPALGDEIVLNATGVGEMGAHGEMQAHREIEADTGKEPFESPLNGFVTVGRDLLLKGDRSGFDRQIRTLFTEFRKSDTEVRMRILAGCRSLLESLTLPVQMHFASACIDPLLSVIREELEPPVLGEAAAMLQTLSDGAVQFADYQLASRIFSAFGERTRSSSSNEALAELLEPKLAASVQRLLQEDLASGNLARQEKAAQVLASMGPPTIPLLIDVIKGQRDYRTRQLAAKLLAGIGPEAARRLKHEILFEVTVVQRTRILEVIDSVTRDLRDELSYCLGDVDAKVRRAAFQLADRLKDESLITVLVPFARSDDLSAAKGAIRSLANFRGDPAVAVIVSVLGTAKDAEVAIACCQALARTGNPSCVDALADVLFVKKRALDVSKNPFLLAILRVISPLFSSRDLSNGDFLSRLLSGRRWGQQVRATAALALGQIPHPRAAELLSSYVEDPDPRVRQLAQSALMRMQVRRKEPASEWPRTPDGAPDPSGEPVT